MFGSSSTNGMEFGVSSDVPHQLLMRLKSFVVLALLASMVSGCALADEFPQSEYEIEQLFIIGTDCDEDCLSTKFEFPAYHNSLAPVLDAITVDVVLREPEGFEYCLSYFGDQSCAASEDSWLEVFAGNLTFPCGPHDHGFLFEAARNEFVGDVLTNLPSLWLAYVDGEVAAIEAETADELLPMFQCAVEAD